MLIVKINIVFLLIFLSQNAFTQIENDFNGKEDAEPMVLMTVQGAQPKS